MKWDITYTHNYGEYTDKGVPLEQVSALTTDEVAVSVVSDYKPKEKLLFVTRKGYVKRVAISEFDTTRKTTDATKLSKDDNVLYVAPTKDKKMVVLVFEQIFCVAFDLSSVSLLKKATAGIIGMKISGKDNISYATVLGEEDEFVVNEKRYTLSMLDTVKRGTKGKAI